MAVQKHRAAKMLAPAEGEPALQATPFLPPIRPDAPLLTDSQRMKLAAIATRVRVSPRTVIYREEAAATWVFIIGEGVVKAFKDLPSGRRWVTAFLYPADVFGLAENGLYIRNAQAVTHATLYRFDVDVLIDTLKGDGELQFKFLCKLTHEVREAQRQTIAIGRKDAVGRVAMFIRELEKQCGGSHELPLPMSRSDIASYLGLSLESVSRATRTLERRGVVCFTGRHMLRITDPVQFEKIESRL
ncbi:MAG TPA: helix-turn-helix domain-containing protein [Vicinamibacterales bacterium]|nr:helix-turn-helix domain-containing protein [Vicinamibacterales bacterium]